VIDEDGMPLGGAAVRFDNVGGGSSGRYESPVELTVESDADGRFQADSITARGRDDLGP